MTQHLSIGHFRSVRGCIDQIFTLKQIGKKVKAYVGFTDLEKLHKVNREALCQMLRKYVDGEILN